MSNNGPATAGSVVAAVALPGSLTETACSAGCVQHAGVISWSQPYLAAGTSVQDTVTVQAASESYGVALVMATASAANPDPDLHNNFGLAIIRITG